MKNSRNKFLKVRFSDTELEHLRIFSQQAGFHNLSECIRNCIAGIVNEDILIQHKMNEIHNHIRQLNHLYEKSKNTEALEILNEVYQTTLQLAVLIEQHFKQTIE